jgi:ATP-dependent RNA helicase DDX10/DBP4
MEKESALAELQAKQKVYRETLGDKSTSSPSERLSLLQSARNFADLPLSRKTLRGLHQSGYTKMTPIQRVAIPYALAGRDLLGAARTGSGKTLAFVVPLLERLYLDGFESSMDGLGAIILTPTRELAYQIFAVLRAVGRYHAFSAGLLIGGSRGVEEERDRLPQMNILIATPGRLLQHLDETPFFDTDRLQFLVLDEADRILDMGFARTLDAIMQQLKTSTRHLARTEQGRQTLLFSATQTKSVRILGRLSLHDPEYIALRDQEQLDHFDMPKRLEQLYVVLEGADQKLSLLYSFLRSHLKQKLLVFLTSCKQVRAFYQILRHMRPGLPILYLNGQMKLSSRLQMYERFGRDPAGCLLATDVAARGLDFTGVDWVLQVDAPDDVAAYVHRVGRTARYQRDGRALLFLTRGKEEHLLEKIQARTGASLHRVRIRPNQYFDVQKKVAAIVAADAHLKYLVQRGLATYLRHIALQSDKEVFDLSEIDVEALALSWGLSAAPAYLHTPQRDQNLAIKPIGRDVYGYRHGDSEHHLEPRTDAVVSENASESQMPRPPAHPNAEAEALEEEILFPVRDTEKMLNSHVQHSADMTPKPAVENEGSLSESTRMILSMNPEHLRNEFTRYAERLAEQRHAVDADDRLRERARIREKRKRQREEILGNA